MAQVSAKVHREVSQVLQNDAVVLVSQARDTLQLFFVEAYPRWVVGIRIDDAADVASR